MAIEREYRESYYDNVASIANAQSAANSAISGSSRNSALNAGQVSLRCFINNTCPFVKNPYEIYNLVFNEDTVKRVSAQMGKDNFSDDVISVLSTTSAGEGIFFRPKYIYRHTYLFLPNKNDKNPVVKYGDIPYSELSKGHYSSVAAAYTRYKMEQSWKVIDSVYDYLDKKEDGTPKDITECNISSWSYNSKTDKSSQISDDDDSYDLVSYAYNKGVRLGKTYTYPVQENAFSPDDRGPVHWRVEKETPLFEGEDFFIHFFKHSEGELDVPKREENGEKIIYERFNESDQSIAIDSINAKKVFFKGNQEKGTRTRNTANKKDFYLMTNQAVSTDVTSLGLSDEEIDALLTIKNTKTGKIERYFNVEQFYLYNKVYYIVELGVGHTDYENRNGNYYIMFVQGAPPIIVCVLNLKGFSEPVSYRLSTCPFIADSSVLLSNDFRMTVRNHLGRLNISFDIFPDTSDTWVVQKVIDIPDYNEETGEYSPTDEEEELSDEELIQRNLRAEPSWHVLTVPRGKVRIWGGNMKAGFCFSPLQYAKRDFQFAYPANTGVFKQNSGNNVFSSASAVSFKNLEKFVGAPMALPIGATHRLNFDTPGIYYKERASELGIPIRANVNTSVYDTVPFFLQDAQFFSNGYNKVKADKKYGSFMFEKTFREFPDITPSWCNFSEIHAKKTKYYENPKNDKEMFETSIGFICGDHIFTDKYWDKLENFSSSDSKGQRVTSGKPATEYPNTANLPDEIWFLPACKTPIMKELSLISEESVDTRWSDGTSSSGTNRLPGNSPYFIDASSLVLNFNDSWNASSWTEVDHTGQISFYLNEHIELQDAQGETVFNPTKNLESLQSKNFYIEIWAGYNGDCNVSRMDGYYKLFTGICQGGKISYEYNKKVMQCKILDYTLVLKAVKFINAPWFDGMKDVNAIWEILRMAGFRSKGKYDPGRLIRDLYEEVTYGSNSQYYTHIDGRSFKYLLYALPSGYNRLENPVLKPREGDTFYSAITKVRDYGSKAFFFDQFGIAHYESFQDLLKEDIKNERVLSSLFEFTSNPNLHTGQLIYQKKEREYGVDKTINHIKLMTSTPDMHLLIRDHMDIPSIINPDAANFLGYRKMFFQVANLLGSAQALDSQIKDYIVAYKPKIHVSFTTNGFPLRAYDIVTVDGEQLWVKEVTHNIDASKNEWKMDVSCVKYQSSADIVVEDNKSTRSSSSE